MRPIICFVCIALVLGLSSCEREIEVVLPNVQPQLVVEGFIEQGSAPQVLITRTQGYFDAVPTTLNELLEYVVKDANVTITDGTTTATLTPTLSAQYPFFYYTTNTLIGEVGKTYQLTIVADGKTLTSSTTIYPPVALDSTWFKLSSLSPSPDSLGLLWFRLTEPSSIGNNYRYYSKRNQEARYLPITGGSVFDDKFINGTSAEYFNARPDTTGGTFDRTIDPEAAYYKIGDTIMTKFCSIGAKEFRFFRTLETSIGSRGNPFAAPTFIESNINGGLGVWCGLGFSYDTCIAKKP